MTAQSPTLNLSFDCLFSVLRYGEPLEIWSQRLTSPAWNIAAKRALCRVTEYDFGGSLATPPVTVRQVVRLCPNLVSVDGWVKGHTRYLIEHCPKLRRIQNMFITADELHDLARVPRYQLTRQLCLSEPLEIVQLKRAFPNLTHVWVGLVPVHIGDYLADFCTQFPNLQALAGPRAGPWEAVLPMSGLDLLAQAISRLPNLRILSLTDYPFSSDQIRRMLTALIHLETLDLSISDLDSVQLLSGMSSLSSLNVDVGVFPEVGELLCADPLNFPSLGFLGLRSAPFPTNQREIDNIRCQVEARRLHLRVELYWGNYFPF